MTDHPVRSAGPVSPPGGFTGRSGGQAPHRPPGRRAQPSPAVDRVSLHGAEPVALRLLRERVLACTRVRLELDDAPVGPEFAEVTEGEPAAAFLGRLLSAQNQLAARRAGSWPAAEVRRRCDEALRAGAQETLDLLAADRRDDAAALAVVAEVLAEYGRRVAALAGDQAEGRDRPDAR